MDEVRLAEIIATGAHYGQTDKGGNPYIEHPHAVSSMVYSKDEKVVAWLHDVVEDTDVTIKDLEKLFPHSICKSVDAITKRNSESRSDYITRVSGDKVATAVKIADLTHNSDLSRLNRKLSREDYNRVKKYAKEIEFLKENAYAKYKFSCRN